MRYGRCVHRHPLPFLVIPPLIALGLSTGLLFLENVSDIEYLYVPYDAPGFAERKLVEERFSWNDVDRFTSLRSLYDQGYLQIIIHNKNGGNVMTQQTINEVFRLDAYVLETTAKFKGNQVNFSDVCSSWKGVYNGNTFLSYMRGRNVSETTITFPIQQTALGPLQLQSQLGDVDVDPFNDVIVTARSLLLQYHVHHLNSQDLKRSSAWLDEALKRVNKFESDQLSIVSRTSASLEQEFNDSVMEVIFLFIVTFGVMSVFAVASMFMNDMVRSKPWVAAGESQQLFIWDH